MVRNQGPGVTLGLGLFQNDGEAVEEGPAVLVIEEKLAAFDASGHDMLEKARSVKSWLAGHILQASAVRGQKSEIGNQEASRQKFRLCLSAEIL
ncbi:MAG: hypothetical protein U5R49_07425 [Deltaproteobacteria bacterium]|nr:hypothetical protein [Deltaproteobacteria bacterium]